MAALPMGDLVAVDAAGDAFSGWAVEVFRVSGRDRGRCVANDAAARGVFAGAFQTGRHTEQVGFRDAGHGADRDDAGAAFGQRAGLVDEECVDLFPCVRGPRRS